MKRLSLILQLLWVMIAYSLAPSDVYAQLRNCDNWLTPDVLREALGEQARGVVVFPSTLESSTSCSRIATKMPTDPFGDQLILLVTQARDPTGAKNTIRYIAEGHESDFYFGWPEGIGDLCVRYLQPDPLSEYRVEFNLSFAWDNLVFELKYFNVDDGNDNVFIFSIQELENVAKVIIDAFGS